MADTISIKDFPRCAPTGIAAEVEAVMARHVLRYATQFCLGKEGDSDRRDFILVARQYGSDSYPIKPWIVGRYGEAGHADSDRTFATLAEALKFGWQWLTEIRGAVPTGGFSEQGITPR